MTPKITHLLNSGAVKSAYGQLMLLVFLPISLLAAVGAYLVERETTRAIEAEQRTLATAALIRYAPVVSQMLPDILQAAVRNSGADHTNTNTSTANNNTANNNTANTSAANTSAMSATSATANLTAVANPLAEIQTRIALILATMSNEQHIQRLAIVNAQGQIIASSTPQNPEFWQQPASLNALNASSPQRFIDAIATTDGTAYGYLLDGYQGSKHRQASQNSQASQYQQYEQPPDEQQAQTAPYWLIVDMDNEPLTIAKMRVWLGLGLTGLFTLLILLLSLTLYARRWIAPVYDLRLHLQGIDPDNMYQAVTTNASGELNQLQQDVIKTLRRLYGHFQELKDHAQQTEEDLRVAFDAMEMQNILIRQARDQAIRSSQAKSAFLANISHELRTPLNSIDGFINLLARHGNLSAEQDLYVQTIRKSSAHLLALVNDVLDFSKIEAGKLVLDQHEFSLYAAIYDVMDMLSPLAAQKNLRMAVMYYNDVPNTIIGDELRVKQVVTNLVANAIKFTEVGEVVVRVGIDEGARQAAAIGDTHLATADAESGSEAAIIHIAVQDTGRGISESAKAHLFESFSQADPTITRQYGGTGLGLIISKQLTRLMQGNIGFYNNDQQDSGEPSNFSHSKQDSRIAQDKAVIAQGATKTGSTFWFSMPAQVQAQPTDELETAAANGDAATEQKFGDIALPVLFPYAPNVMSLSGAVSNAADAVGNAPASNKQQPAALNMLVWLDHKPSRQVLMAALSPLKMAVTAATSLAGALESLKEDSDHWDWVIIDGGASSAHADSAALLKQIRLHYQGKLAIYDYQVVLDATLLKRYRAFALYQPLDKRQLYAMLDTRANRQKALSAPLMWQGVTVLAVDDHLPNLLVLDALLSELGIQVITANSGQEAIVKLSQQFKQQAQVKQQAQPIVVNPNMVGIDTAGTDRTVMDTTDAKRPKQAAVVQTHPSPARNIDLIFMDLQMPRMSGEEATQQIRQLEDNLQRHSAGLSASLSDAPRPLAQHQSAPRAKHIPIIALTAHNLTDEKQRLLAAGFDDYVGKPISRPQLLQVLQHWLGRGVAGVLPKTDKLDLHSSAYPDSYAHSANPANLANSAPQPDDTGSLAAAAAPVVDWQDALTRSANKPDLAKQLLTMMQEATAGDIAALQQAWQSHNREQLAQIAHRILGASRYTGVPQIRKASQHLEDKALLNVQHTIPSQFILLSPYYQELLASLQALQALDLSTYFAQATPLPQAHEKPLSENDMTWKMI